MPLLSVIIPIYNTPKAVLLRCLDSLSTLTVDYEALLIDDGSEEAVGILCRDYVNRNPACRYIRRENGGVSAARNQGIREARGEYLLFLDADDELLGQAIAQPLPRCDLIFFDALVRQGEQERRHAAFPTETVDPEAVLLRLLTSKALNSPWAKLFRREALGDTVFPEDFVTGEDWMFVTAAAEKACSVCYIPTPCYRYDFDPKAAGRRAGRHPDGILENQLTRFARKEQLIASRHWSSTTAEAIRSLAAVELVENLFNTATDLLSAGCYTKPRRQRLCQAAREAGRYLTAAPKKTGLKLLVLTKAPVLLRPLAWLRSAYLN